MKLEPCKDLLARNALKGAVNRAIQKDRKALKQSDKKYMEDMQERRSVDHTFKTTAAAEVAEGMAQLRDIFRGRVIRRTVDSLDDKGQPISGLRPYQTHELYLTLSVKEKEVFDAMFDEVLAPQNKNKALGNVSDPSSSGSIPLERMPHSERMMVAGDASASRVCVRGFCSVI